MCERGEGLQGVAHFHGRGAGRDRTSGGEVGGRSSRDRVGNEVVTVALSHQRHEQHARPHVAAVLAHSVDRSGAVAVQAAPGGLGDLGQRPAHGASVTRARR